MRSDMPLSEQAAHKRIFSLFVGNIGINTTELELAAVFSVYASYFKSRVVHNKKSHYGFVSFESYKDAASAMIEQRNCDLGKGRLIIKVSKRTAARRKKFKFTTS